jgi:hypothetical protein
VLFLGEPMTWYKIVGLAAAVIGVVLISIWQSTRWLMEAICQNGSAERRKPKQRSNKFVARLDAPAYNIDVCFVPQADMCLAA